MKRKKNEAIAIFTSLHLPDCVQFKWTAGERKNRIFQLESKMNFIQRVYLK